MEWNRWASKKAGRVVVGTRKSSRQFFPAQNAALGEDPFLNINDVISTICRQLHQTIQIYCVSFSTVSQRSYMFISKNEVFWSWMKCDGLKMFEVWHDASDSPKGSLHFPRENFLSQIFFLCNYYMMCFLITYTNLLAFCIGHCTTFWNHCVCMSKWKATLSIPIHIGHVWVSNATLN